MQKYVACLTLDLEPDYGGRAGEKYSALETSVVSELLGILRKHAVPLTVFVVAKTLHKNRSVVEAFVRFGAEFHLHSYSHDLNNPDSIEEIQRGKEAFTRFFHKPPRGYRAPEGRISESGLEILAEEGFDFDASIFPTFWPHPKYVRYPRVPFRPLGDRALVELPFATVSPLRLVVSLSWIRFFGWWFFHRLLTLFPLPSILIIDMHVHDLWRAPSYSELPWLWKIIYGRHTDGGIRYLEKCIVLLKKRGYRFDTVTRIYKTIT